jgi:hypothetical protein
LRAALEQGRFQDRRVSPLLLDAITDSDLDAIAHHAAAAGAQTLIVGSGGLPPRWPAAGPSTGHPLRRRPSAQVGSS